MLRPRSKHGFDLRFGFSPMPDSPRIRRLRSDQRALVQLKSESTIFDFIPIGEPADQYVLKFKGRGVYRPENASDVMIRDRMVERTLEVYLRVARARTGGVPAAP